ncbi:hypothetical protein HaLaN_07039, partial [Haematococcus lacustris]
MDGEPTRKHNKERLHSACMGSFTRSLPPFAATEGAHPIRDGQWAQTSKDQAAARYSATLTRANDMLLSHYTSDTGYD